MKSARWYGPLDIRLEEVPIPTPRSDEALVRVHWTGLCGSDVEEYLAGPVVVTPPVTLGHEIVGSVAVAARNGSGPPVGTPVVVDVVTGCGECFSCRRHEEGRCLTLVVTGQHVDGGLAEYVVGRASRLVVVPPGLELRHAALAEPAAVAIRAVRRVGSLLGQTALVIGGGTIGLLVAQVLRNSGAPIVVVVEPSERRRMVAASLGFVTVWAASETERASARSGLVPERGVDVVVECSGASGAAREAVRAVRRGGTVILLSVTPEDQAIDAADLVIGEKSVHGSAAHMWDDDVAVAVTQLAAGQLQVEPLVSLTVALNDVGTAFFTLADSSDLIKLLVDCAS